MGTSRRDFLKMTAGAPAVLSLGAAAPAFLKQAAAAANAGRGDRVLVVVQLAGGNDGLNTVVPYDNDEYGRGRTTLRMTSRDVIKLDEPGLGFHPQMTALKRLLDDGHLGIVQGVGYPNPDGGHGPSMRIWQTARLDAPTCQTGWLGRALDTGSVPGAFVGQISKPLGINAAKAFVPTIRTIEDCRLRSSPAVGAGRLDSSGGSPLLEQVAQRTKAAHAYAARIDEVVRSGVRREYPETPFGANLRIVAQLIEADIGVRIFHTELGGIEPGGFDNHANQKDNHAALIRQLSQGVAAFVDDLRRAGQLDRMMLVTFSEFGRTVTENGRHGTGHGSAAPMLLAGGRVRAGLIGEHPTLAKPERENDGPKHHTDFRRVYASLLDDWLGIDSHPVLGQRFKPIQLQA